MTAKEKPASGGYRTAGYGDASSCRNSTLIDPTCCPKWHKCSVPLCPLDPDAFKRVMRDDEPVCFYLTEAVKGDAEAVFKRRGREELFAVVSALIQPMSSRWGRIKRALERAKTTSSRMATVAPWEVGHVRPD